MNFNFSQTAGVSQSSTRKHLEGNQIHKVIFDGCEARDFDKKDGTGVFHVLEMKFHNEDGEFTHTEWEPTEADQQDRENAFGNKQPSNVLTMMYRFKHLIDAVNPELAEKIDKGEASLTASSWDGLRKLMVKSCEAGIGKTTKIKLIKNNKGDAIFPYFLNYSREGKLYMSTNFIGDKIAFTDKELTKIKRAETATPTQMSSVSEIVNTVEDTTANTSDDDFDMHF